MNTGTLTYIIAMLITVVYLLSYHVVRAMFGWRALLLLCIVQLIVVYVVIAALDQQN